MKNQQQHKRSDILSKYDLGVTPKIDSTIPSHLMPTPLQNNKTKSKFMFDDSLIDTRSRRAKLKNNEQTFKRSKSTSPERHWNFDNENANNNDNGNNGSGHIEEDSGVASPSEIKFAFGDPAANASDVSDLQPMMSPIPFSRNIGGKFNNDDANKEDTWSKFMPTPLKNQKTKS